MLKLSELKNIRLIMTFAIIGTGGHAKSIYDIIKNRTEVTFFDNKKIFK